VTWPFRSDTFVDTRLSILLRGFGALGKDFSVRVGVTTDIYLVHVYMYIIDPSNVILIIYHQEKGLLKMRSLVNGAKIYLHCV
jgi:hypothetical protein